MKIYLAAAFAQKDEVAQRAAEVVALGHSITHDWFNDPPLPGNGIDVTTKEECKRRARADLHGISKANLIVVLAGLSYTGGKHVEVGYAMATGKRIALVGKPENVFHWLIGEQYDTWEQFVAELRAQASEEEMKWQHSNGVAE
jgi:nucleoside 2-deoxyribosyltransferase